jgi:hypothetical protein
VPPVVPEEPLVPSSSEPTDGPDTDGLGEPVTPDGVTVLGGSVVTPPTGLVVDVGESGSVPRAEGFAPVGTVEGGVTVLGGSVVTPPTGLVVESGGGGGADEERGAEPGTADLPPTSTLELAVPTSLTVPTLPVLVGTSPSG